MAHVGGDVHVRHRPAVVQCRDVALLRPRLVVIGAIVGVGVALGQRPAPGERTCLRRHGRLHEGPAVPHLREGRAEQVGKARPGNGDIVEAIRRVLFSDGEIVRPVEGVAPHALRDPTDAAEKFDSRLEWNPAVDVCAQLGLDIDQHGTWILRGNKRREARLIGKGATHGSRYR